MQGQAEEDVTPIDPPIKEWHFHVYFFQTDTKSYQQALNIRDSLLYAVKQREFIAVFNGVTDAIYPGLDTSKIPPINLVPRGPHPCGSFEVWVPFEHYAAALSWFTLNRGELTILIHPLTRHEYDDHSCRALWLGPKYRLNLSVFQPRVLPAIPLQYPELRLGYSARTKL
eukprot:TRINITY_DN929_c0_g1_i1.p1 TRINITY_DN929_c0_g1~~TRINITY_DN929_c0_g1_i1.p1  ORF type:complete len:170 (+),score=12.90 TRINITY_DN929_c0_g1_i1:70-579(+)